MGCTVKCWDMPDCAVCGMRKHPRGRDPGLYAASGYCAHECGGHNLEPLAGHFWPGEHADGCRTHKGDDCTCPLSSLMVTERKP